jgi:hypothetical protein
LGDPGGCQRNGRTAVDRALINSVPSAADSPTAVGARPANAIAKARRLLGGDHRARQARRRCLDRAPGRRHGFDRTTVSHFQAARIAITVTPTALGTMVAVFAMANAEDSLELKQGPLGG